MGVAAVYDDIARVEHRNKFLDKVIYSLTGLDHKEHLARALEG